MFGFGLSGAKQAVAIGELPVPEPLTIRLELQVQVLISNQFRFIFVKTRKTAGTSTQLALIRHMDHPDDVIAPVQRDIDEAQQWGGGVGKNVEIPMRNWRARDWYWAARGMPRMYKEHMPAKLIRTYVGRETWDDYFTFTIERNPWDQVISRYFYHFRPERGRAKVPFEEFIFSDLLPAWSNWPIYTHKDEVIVDKVVIYERLDEELNAITDQLGIPRLVLPHAKSHYRTDQRPYQEWYTPATRARVAAVFHKEIETFAFTFD